MLVGENFFLHHLEQGLQYSARINNLNAMANPSADGVQVVGNRLDKVVRSDINHSSEKPVTAEGQ